MRSARSKLDALGGRQMSTTRSPNVTMTLSQANEQQMERDINMQVANHRQQPATIINIENYHHYNQ